MTTKRRRRFTARTSRRGWRSRRCGGTVNGAGDRGQARGPSEPGGCLERLAGAGLVKGKTVGVDATTLEANAAMRSIERRDTGESYEAFVRQLAKASGIETPTRAELARFDRSRKDRKTSNKAWQSPQDRDAKIAKMKDGRTHLAHKAEHGVDLETGAILSVTVQDASEGDSATLPETLTMAAEQVEAVRPDGAEVEEVVADKGYHSDATDAGGSRRDWGSQLRLGAGAGSALLARQEDGRDAGGEACCAEGTIWEPSAYSRRPRSSSSTPPRGAGGAAFRAPVRDRGPAAGVGARPRECAQAGAHPGGRLQPRTAAAPPDRRRHAPEPAGAGSFGHLRTDRAPDRALGASDGLLGLPMDASGAGRLNRSSPSCLNRSAQRIDFFHGLPGSAGAGCRASRSSSDDPGPSPELQAHLTLESILPSGSLLIGQAALIQFNAVSVVRSTKLDNSKVCSAANP